MRVNIRYRLIQFVEILLWLGAAAGLGTLARRIWALRDQGWRAMLDLAAPGLLTIGAVMAVLVVLIGIYHNTRRNADALDRLARQGAGGMRRLSGAVRTDMAAPAQPATSATHHAAQTEAARPPVFSAVTAHIAGDPARDLSAPPKFGPSPTLRSATQTGAAVPVLRGQSRRIGPAS
ncbi:hypothetical protein FQV27_07205 [Paracoccus aurantiacus]|uniref:Uncharacterized protein n=1 Tax=Paracoccus aurantiacus TaxID=2599412 RepID=A0A5C6S665_9RHOB|nr:hypothetical protein [Paracoccus aurantiacus]TXB69889.1 hypothetical protein FQV27_07205 [Paracoccus aurantiacus]